MGRANIEVTRNIIHKLFSEEVGEYLIKTIRQDLIVSTDQNRFLVIRTGWSEGSDFYSVILDIELKEGLVYIYRDNNEDDIADDLIDAGIRKKDIIKSYYSPTETN